MDFGEKDHSSALLHHFLKILKVEFPLENNAIGFFWLDRRFFIIGEGVIVVPVRDIGC